MRTTALEWKSGGFCFAMIVKGMRGWSLGVVVVVDGLGAVGRGITPARNKGTGSRLAQESTE